MINITGAIKDKLSQRALETLYREVGWVSYTKDIEKLYRGICNSLFVVTAWEDETLIGLLRVVGDGETILYIQDIVVSPNYRRLGVASSMIEKVLETYPEVRQKVLLTEDESDLRAFYETNGFISCDHGDLVAFVRFD